MDNDIDDFDKQIFEICEGKQNIFIFVSKADEIDTIKLSKINSVECLVPSSYGILEPKPEYVIPFPKEDMDIFFVPGTKFDYFGNRKGRGKGYFDRFLADVKGKKPIIGLCYKDQVVEKLLPNEWDVPVDRTIIKKK